MSEIVTVVCPLCRRAGDKSVTTVLRCKCPLGPEYTCSRGHCWLECRLPEHGHRIRVVQEGENTHAPGFSRDSICCCPPTDERPRKKPRTIVETRRWREADDTDEQCRDYWFVETTYSDGTKERHRDGAA